MELTVVAGAGLTPSILTDVESDKLSVGVAEEDAGADGATAGRATRRAIFAGRAAAGGGGGPAADIVSQFLQTPFSERRDSAV